jgi:signal transduction histidine kinase/CheY-like chemotaxis protein
MLSSQYDTTLVWVSVFVAMLASYTALCLAVCVKQSGKLSSWFWMGGGAFAMGTGIWSMHFIGMLAFKLPIGITYDLQLTFLSWVIAAAVAGIALWQISQPKLGLKRLVISAVLVGVSINVMHFVGMSAMRIEPGIVYNLGLVFLSVIIAVSSAAAALWIAFFLQRNDDRVGFRLVGAVIMGLGISGMHYTGMASAGFPIGSVCASSGSSLALEGLALAIIIATVSILVITLITLDYHSRLKSRAKLLAITQEVADERQLLLEREMRAREEAEKARVEAERTNALKDEFLATLSHELRTPLNSILGWVQLLQIRDIGDPVVKNGLKVVERNARAQGELIEDLLDMSGIASGKIRLENEVVDPALLIKKSIDMVLPAATRKSITVTYSLDKSTGTVLGDPSRLGQVVGNLLGNALKFTPSGGTVHVGLSRHQGMIEIRIKDSGAGIPPDFLPHVFDLFRQADSSTTRRHGGLGIGLSIVKQLTELHGGNVVANSDGLGCGATFSVSLPIYSPSGFVQAVPTKPEKASEIDLESNDLRGAKIMVVDDHVDAAQLLKGLLERCNATVIVAYSGQEAVAQIANAQPDLLISDIGMPDMDGIELIRLIRSMDHPVAKVTSIALSAYTRDRDRDNALSAGFDRYISKPVDGSLLVATVARMLPSSFELVHS